MSEPCDADAVTLATIRSWAARTIRQTEGCTPGGHAAGFRLAARSVQAILDVHGKPADYPVHFPVADPGPIEVGR